MGDKDPRQMHMGDLVEMARRKGVQGVERMNKEEILRAIGIDQPGSSAPGQGGGPGDRPAPAGTKPQDWKNIPGNQS
ncbi:MAG: hypothetical protein V7603_4369 [Micromonosporaceae bacterium]